MGAIWVRTVKLATISAMIGNVVEWYDFALYTAATPLVFSRIFFSQQHDPFLTQIETIAVFALGFLVRPLGGMIFGAIGDRYGSVTSLRWTLFIIGGATALIGTLPTYEQIGLLAPLLLLVLRLVQGIAAGGEWAGSTLVIGQARPPGRPDQRNIALALSQSGVALGMVLGTATMWGLRHMPEHVFLSWGWRFGFLATLPFVAVGLFLRSQRELSGKETLPQARQPRLMQFLRQKPLTVIRGVGIRLAENGGIYLISVFGLVYGRAHHVPDSLLLAGMTCGLIADGFAMPFFGWLSTRFGAAQVYLAGICALVLLIVPFFWVVSTGQPVAVIGGFVLIMMLGHAPMIAVEPILLERLFPPFCQYSGVALAHELGSTLAGGISPFLATVLYYRTGSVTGIMVYVFLLALGSAMALYRSGMHEVVEDHSSQF
ncbi:MFS transporter [Gluconobacter sp. DsW_056]|uniref:MFS transporter n=1 Tax=Gluconobacter sp. DsW_056 TaxID=1511209 RepID=UPI001E2F0E20|nr:MFS transporter [Gluconobacter sp. DsW_056]